LKKVYEDGNVIAVDNVNFEVYQGEIFSFLGPNGAGKTTTINIASTNMTPSSGTVKIFGHDITNETKEVRKHIGICPQDLVFYQNLTIYENVIFFGKMYDKNITELKKYATFLIDHVGLSEKRDVLASKLSGGMKRRLNLIIGLVNDPDILFLDEPTAGLDPQTRHLIWDFIKSLKERGKTIFMTTHYMDEADALSDRVAIIDHGKIIALDHPFDLKRQHSGGDIIEFKFKESDTIALEKLGNLKNQTDAKFKEFNYIEEDSLFRVVLHEGLQNLGSVIEQIGKLGLSISDMNVKSNTLENVFISMTGKTLRE
jgi:ABC-2 type transport system ATP-binding protein